jgi:hypothetical protein
LPLESELISVLWTPETSGPKTLHLSERFDIDLNTKNVYIILTSIKEHLVPWIKSIESKGEPLED